VTLAGHLLDFSRTHVIVFDMITQELSGNGGGLAFVVIVRHGGGWRWGGRVRFDVEGDGVVSRRFLCVWVSDTKCLDVEVRWRWIVPCVENHGVVDFIVLNAHLGTKRVVAVVTGCQGKCGNVGAWVQRDGATVFAVIPSKDDLIEGRVGSSTTSAFVMLLLRPMLGREQPDAPVRNIVAVGDVENVDRAGIVGDSPSERSLLNICRPGATESFDLTACGSHLADEIRDLVGDASTAAIVYSHCSAVGVEVDGVWCASCGAVLELGYHGLEVSGT